MRGPLARQRRVFQELAAGAEGGAPLASDPVELVRAYPDPGDQEVAGLLAALLAYGQVAAIRRTVGWVLERLGTSPRVALLEGWHLRTGWGRGFRYRFNRRGDLIRLCEGVAETLRQEESLGRALARRRTAAGDLDAGLAQWVADLRERALAGRKGSYGLGFLLPDPRRGGACKRWRLYLRWMVRPADGIDLGAWSHLIPARELLLPLDTHWIRIGRRLGLSRRKTPDRKMVLEMTEALLRLDPEDPLRFDFAVCHLGVRGGCPPKLKPEHCRACPLRPVCPTGAILSVRRRTRT